MLFRALNDMHTAAKARWEKLVETQNHLGLVSSELGGLIKLGDMVGPDDVIKSSAALVSSGIDPRVLATWLADMPQTTGEPLLAWLSQHVQMAQAGMAQLAPLMESARHQLGQSALGVIAGHHLGTSLGASDSSMATGANAGASPTSPNPVSASNPLMGSA